MANIKFKLRANDPSKEQPIYLVYYLGKDIFRYSTKLKVYPKNWNKRTERLRDKIDVESKNEINNFLDQLQSEANKRIRDYKIKNREIDKEVLKSIIEEITNPTPEPTNSKENTLFGFIEDFLIRAKTRVNPKTGRLIAYYTVRKYHQCFNELKKYEQEYNTTLSFESIDLEFYENFIEMLRKRNQSNNNIGKHIKTIKVFLNDATVKGINTNQKFKSDRFKAFSETADAIYLNIDELQKIYSLDLSKNTKLEKVRDLFIVGSWTGLRFGDFTSIKPEFIIGNFLHIEQHKTLGKVTIPLHPIVLEILNKYKGNLPKAISNQKFNEYLKEIGKLAELTEPVYKTITRGGKRISTKYKKWELITSHTGRRSFASNLYKSGFPAKSIMQITGHKTEIAFQKYVKLTPDEHAKLLQQHWQQQGAFLKVAK